MNVYFARSLRGDRSQGDEALYKGIVGIIKTCGHRTQFELPVTLNRQNFSANAYIYRRDIDWIDRCDVMIAEVTNPSHGVGYEIAYADHVRHMLILQVAVKDTNVSAMIAGGLDVHYYRDLGDLQGIIELFLEHAQQGMPS